MSETYQSKQERRQRLLESFPAGLREHISVRNIDAVAGLSQQAQERLLEAVQAGLKRLSRALEQLRVDPNTSVADLLHPPAPSKPELPNQDFPKQIQTEVVDLIQQCFPDMPRVSAEALAEADVMEHARTIAQTHQQMFKSNHIRTDFVMLTLYGLMRQTLERLEEIIEDTPALRRAFDQGDLPWKPNDWRKQNA